MNTEAFRETSARFPISKWVSEHSLSVYAGANREATTSSLPTVSCLQSVAIVFKVILTAIKLSLVEEKQSRVLANLQGIATH